MVVFNVVYMEDNAADQLSHIEWACHEKGRIWPVL